MTEEISPTEAKPFLMLPEPLTDPHALIVEFFRLFHLEDAQELFWGMCKGALISSEFETPMSRSNLFFFAELMMQFFGATQQLFAPHASKHAQLDELLTAQSAKSTSFTLDEEALRQVQALFASFAPEELERDLELWLKVALSADHVQYQEGKDRGNLISLHNQLRDLLRSIYRHVEITEKSHE